MLIAIVAVIVFAFLGFIGYMAYCDIMTQKMDKEKSNPKDKKK